MRERSSVPSERDRKLEEGLRGWGGGGAVNVKDGEKRQTQNICSYANDRPSHRERLAARWAGPAFKPLPPWVSHKQVYT